MSKGSVRDYLKRFDLLRRAKRQIRTMIQGRKYAPHKELPAAKLMTDRRLRNQPWAQPLDEPDWRGPGDYAHMRPHDPVLGVYRKCQGLGAALVDYDRPPRRQFGVG